MNKLLEKLFDKFDNYLHKESYLNLQDRIFSLEVDLEEAEETISMYVDNAEVIRRIR